MQKLKNPERKNLITQFWVQPSQEIATDCPKKRGELSRREREDSVS